MGTSKAYSGLKGKPNWKPLSTDVTRSCGNGTSESSKSRIMSNLITTWGGASDVAYGKSRIAGRAGVYVAQNFGALLSSIQTDGFESAIRSLNPEANTNDANQSISQILESCAGTVTLMDEAAAKDALKDLLKEIKGAAVTNNELEAGFIENLEKYGQEEVIIKYYSYYIYEHLSTIFYEKLIKEKGKSATANFYKQIKSFIKARLKNISRNRSLQKLEWRGDKGKEFVQSILFDTLQAFEGYEG